MMSNLYQLSPVFHRTKASDIGVVDSMAFAKAHMHMKRQVLPSQYLPYGNPSTFSISAEEQEMGTELKVTLLQPCEGLSKQGKE